MIVVDGNAIGFAGQHGKTLRHEGREVQSIYQFLRSMKRVRERFKDDGDICVLWDGRAQFRFDLYPEYKGTRNKTDEQKHAKTCWTDCKADVQDILPLLGVSQFISFDHEADDLAGYFTRKLPGKTIRLITGDQDWMQLVNPSVSWHDMRSNMDKDCDFVTFCNVTGYTDTKQFLVAKAMQGDSSDNITGVGGLGPKAATGIMQVYGGVEALLEHHRTVGEFGKGDLDPLLSRYRKKLNEFCTVNKAMLVRNLKLMDLKSGVHDADISDGIQVTRSGLDMTEFMQRCREYSFMSIVGYEKRWRQTFGET